MQPPTSEATVAAAAAESDDLVKIDRAARKLGSTPGTVRAWVARGQIPVVRLGTRAIRFSLRDLDRWIDERKRGGK